MTTLKSEVELNNFYIFNSDHGTVEGEAGKSFCNFYHFKQKNLIITGTQKVIILLSKHRSFGCANEDTGFVRSNDSVYNVNHYKFTSKCIFNN